MTDPVVDCIWVIGVLECATEAAYVFDKVVTSSMTVQIPRVSTNETGKYTCQITGSKSEDLESCELLLSAGIYIYVFYEDIYLHMFKC